MSKYKVDLNTILKKIDSKDRKYYQSLSSEEKKSVSAIVLMRFISSSNKPYSDYSLIAVNDMANKHFYEMKDHPELQYLLLTAASSGLPTRHNWIAGSKKNNIEPLYNLISKFWPQSNRMEKDIILSKFDANSFSDFVDGCGIDQEEAKKVKKLFKSRI